MATTSVDGLVSGLSTSGLIDQLMQVEASSQTKLKQRQSDTQKQIDAFTSLNGKLASLQTAAKNLQKPDGLVKFSATSSATSVVATATAGAEPQSLSFKVDALATAAVRVATPVYTSTDDAVTTTLSIPKKCSTTPLNVDVK